MNLVKIIFFYLCVSVILFFTGWNLLDKLDAVTWHYKADNYGKFVNLKSTPSINSALISFLQKNISSMDSSCCLWEDPQCLSGEIVLETEISNVAYYLYPLKLSLETGGMKTRPDYILCRAGDYEALKLYMVFYEFDDDYVKADENDNWVILKRKAKSQMKNKLTRLSNAQYKLLTPTLSASRKGALC